VLARLLQGDTNKEIAAHLRCTKRTIEFHVRNILKKAGCKSRSKLIARHRETTP
jgi:DNA-binding CsgD family transcriptional regulator